MKRFLKSAKLWLTLWGFICGYMLGWSPHLGATWQLEEVTWPNPIYVARQEYQVEYRCDLWETRTRFPVCLHYEHYKIEEASK